jgi:hypothetical protein
VAPAWFLAGFLAAGALARNAVAFAVP